jgi:EmrB/QacA subfamily drug resistance transporter
VSTATHANVTRRPEVSGRPVDRRRWLTLALVSVAQFMLVLDVTVVNVALPDIGADLHLTRATLTWVISSYALLFGGLMLLGGRAADLFGARRVLLVGLAAFTAASLVNGLASEGWMLLAGRAGQGMGAALLSPAALSVITATFHGADRARALGVWAAIGGTGSAVGVLLGGVLTAGPGWEWVFFINVPVGLVLLAALPSMVPVAAQGPRGQRIDAPGAAMATAATAAFIYGLINTGDHGWRASSTILSFAAALVLYAGFVARQTAARSPLMDLRMMTRRPVLSGAFLMLVATGLLISVFFLGSFYLQSARGHGALTTGLMFLPVALATIVGAHTGSRMVPRVGGRWLAAAGLVVAALGAVLPAASLGTATLVTGISVVAAGAGATFVAATTTAMARVAPGETGVASGLINTFHELGGAIGVAVISSIAAPSIAAATATTAGFTAAFVFSASAALLAAAIAALLLPAGRPPAGITPHAH